VNDARLHGVQVMKTMRDVCDLNSGLVLVLIILNIRDLPMEYISHPGSESRTEQHCRCPSKVMQGKASSDGDPSGTRHRMAAHWDAEAAAI